MDKSGYARVFLRQNRVYIGAFTCVREGSRRLLLEHAATPFGQNRAQTWTKTGAWCMVDKIGHFPNFVDGTGHTRVFWGQNQAYR